MLISKLVENNNISTPAFDVLGLNIFSANRIGIGPNEDPLLVFLNSLIQSNSVGCLIGNLFDYAASPTELFGNSAYANLYKEVRVGIYSGIFYSAKEWNSFPPLYFSRIANDFLSISENSRNLIQRILLLDAIAFFVFRSAGEQANSILKLVESGFHSSEEFVEQASSVCDAIVTSQADGDFFTVYSLKDASFIDSLLAVPIRAAETSIRSSNWFKKNASKLEWNNEFDVLRLADR